MGRLRSRSVALVLGLLGSGLALLALTASWAHLASSALPGSRLTGRQVSPGAFALALAALAGTGALLLLGRTGRRIAGVLLVLLGAGTAVAAWVGALRLSDRSALPAAWASGIERAVTTPAWAAVVVVGGLLVVAAGILAVLGGPGWPDRSARYSGSGRPADADLWRALDEGVDPTVDG